MNNTGLGTIFRAVGHVGFIFIMISKRSRFQGAPANSEQENPILRFSFLGV